MHVVEVLEHMFTACLLTLGQDPVSVPSFYKEQLMLLLCVVMSMSAQPVHSCVCVYSTLAPCLYTQMQDLKSICGLTCPVKCACLRLGAPWLLMSPCRCIMSCSCLCLHIHYCAYVCMAHLCMSVFGCMSVSGCLIYILSYQCN